MFTGIIENTGIVKEKLERNRVVQYTILSDLVSELYLGQSISHNGICLTVIEIFSDSYVVQLVPETMDTAVADWMSGELINLERAMAAAYRFDGHIVQGHVDGKGKIEQILISESEIRIRITFSIDKQSLIVPKGSICVNGISLTVAALGENWFEVAIIPHTWKITNLNLLVKGRLVNLEFDILGKYINRYMELLHRK